MRIESQLHIASHPDRDAEKGYSFTNGEPHAMGLIKIPFDQIEKHDRLKEIYEALPDDAKEFVKKEGNLALSHDFSFVEDYKSGLGLVMTDLKLDASRLSDEEKTKICDWMRSEYLLNIRPEELADGFEDHYKDHILTDMTFAGMSRDYMMTAIAEHVGKVPEEDRKCDLLPPELMDKYFASLKDRLELSDTPDLTPGSADRLKLDGYYERVLEMEDSWPSTDTEANYGREENKDQGKVIFFKGFISTGEEVIKAGPYAYSCAWPEKAHAEFDENGIAIDADKKVVAPKDIRVDEDYVYPPNTVLTKSYEGDAAKQIIDRILSKDAKAYDGYNLNCVGVSGRRVFGEDFDKIPNRGPKNDKLWDPSHVKELNDNGKLPEGMASFSVDVQKADRSVDQNALHAATKEVASQQAAMQKSGLSGMEKTAAVAALAAGAAALGAGVKPGKPQENGQPKQRTVFGRVAKVAAAVVGIGVLAAGVESLRRGESVGTVVKSWANFVTSRGNGGHQPAR